MPLCRFLALPHRAGTWPVSRKSPPLHQNFGSPLALSLHPCSRAQGSLFIMAHIATCVSPGVEVKRLSIPSYIVPPLSPLPDVTEVSSFFLTFNVNLKAPRADFPPGHNSKYCCWNNYKLTSPLLYDRPHTTTTRRSLGFGGWLNQIPENTSFSLGTTRRRLRQ